MDHVVWTSGGDYSPLNSPPIMTHGTLRITCYRLYDKILHDAVKYKSRSL